MEEPRCPKKKGKKRRGEKKGFYQSLWQGQKRKGGKFTYKRDFFKRGKGSEWRHEPYLLSQAFP